MNKSACDCYQRLSDKLDGIETYIDMLEEQREFILDKGDNESEYVQLLRKTKNSPISYNAIIIGIYGAFEHYVDELFGEFLEYRKLQGLGLTDGEKKSYFTMACDFIANPTRYRNYRCERLDVIKNLYDIEQQTTGFPLTELMLRHSGNLSFKHTVELAKQIGIKEFEQEFCAHVKDCNYLFQILNEDLRNELSRSEKQIEEKWQVIIDQRNSIAHTGEVDNRFSYPDLKDYTQIFSAIGYIILHIVLEQMATYMIKNGNMKAFFPVHRIFGNNILGTDLGDKPIRIGDMIVSRNSEGKCRMLYVDCIHVNKESVDFVCVPGTTICIKVDKPIKTTHMFYYF